MLLQRSLNLVLIISALIAAGTAGYCWIEGWSIDDAFYMTIITISTVGYTEIGELGTTGRVFTSILILASIVCMAFWTARITSVLVEGDLSGVFRTKRMNRMAKRMKGHVIVCGANVFAASIIDLLHRANREVVVISEDKIQLEELSKRYSRLPYINQAATDELALAQASLAAASHVVAATETDVDNLLIAMTCKQLNPSLKVYSFSFDGKLASRMMKVGVDEVICPHLLGGNRVCELIEQRQQNEQEDEKKLGTTLGTTLGPSSLSPGIPAGPAASTPIDFQVPHQTE